MDLGKLNIQSSKKCWNENWKPSSVCTKNENMSYWLISFSCPLFFRAFAAPYCAAVSGLLSACRGTTVGRPFSDKVRGRTCRRLSNGCREIICSQSKSPWRETDASPAKDQKKEDRSPTTKKEKPNEGGRKKERQRMCWQVFYSDSYVQDPLKIHETPLAFFSPKLHDPPAWFPTQNTTKNKTALSWTSTKNPQAPSPPLPHNTMLFDC